jgi:hypothetical protein
MKARVSLRLTCPEDSSAEGSGRRWRALVRFEEEGAHYLA